MGATMTRMPSAVAMPVKIPQKTRTECFCQTSGRCPFDHDQRNIRMAVAHACHPLDRPAEDVRRVILLALKVDEAQRRGLARLPDCPSRCRWPRLAIENLAFHQTSTVSSLYSRKNLSEIEIWPSRSFPIRQQCIMVALLFPDFTLHAPYIISIVIVTHIFMKNVLRFRFFFPRHWIAFLQLIWKDIILNAIVIIIVLVLVKSSAYLSPCNISCRTMRCSVYGSAKFFYFLAVL